MADTPIDRTRGTVILLGSQSERLGHCVPAPRPRTGKPGLATLKAEGQGKARRGWFTVFMSIWILPAVYRCFVMHVEDDSRGASGTWGNSVEGLWAASTAATDDRVRACCINGVLAAATFLPFRAFADQAAARLGSHEEAAIQANFERRRFRAAATRPPTPCSCCMAAPILS